MLKRLLVLPLLALGSLGASEQFSIGIGGLYSSSKATNANVKDSGIYLNFRGDEISENYRTKIGAEFEYGFGISKTSGSLFSYLDKFGSENKFEYWDFLIRPGFNIFTKEVPLFINLLVGLEFYTNKKTDKNKAFWRDTLKIGVEAEGAIPLGQSLKLTYSGAYLPTITSYQFGRLDGGRTPESDIDKFSYDIVASVGFITKLTQSRDLYVKAKGKYRTFSKSNEVPIDSNGTTSISNINYPAHKSVDVMVEVGVIF